MPKEFTHILFADTVLDAIETDRDGRLAHLLRANRATYRFGALAPDLFYYAVPLPMGARFGPWGEIVHGEAGEDTAAALIAMLEGLRSTGEETALFGPGLAYAAGFATHMALDQVVHPWVYALSGQYYHADPTERNAAVARHRAIEGLLDHHVHGEAGLQRMVNAVLPTLVAARAANVAALAVWADCFSRVHQIDAAVLPALERGMAVQQALLHWLPNRWAGRLARGLNRLSADRLSPLAALFHPPPAVTGTAAHWLTARGFVHPATGAWVDQDFAGLWHQALVRATASLSAIYDYATGVRDRASLAAALPGVGLSLGLAGYRTAEARHFQPSPLA